MRREYARETLSLQSSRASNLAKWWRLVAFFFLWGGTFFADLDLLMETSQVCEATRVPFFFLKEGTVTYLETGTARSQFSLTWTQDFNLGAGIGMVWEAGMEGAMVSSPSWLQKWWGWAWLKRRSDAVLGKIKLWELPWKNENLCKLEGEEQRRTNRTLQDFPPPANLTSMIKRYKDGWMGVIMVWGQIMEMVWVV
jgi:hypothetical protein